MSNPIIHIHDENGEYDREMTAAEFTQYTADKAADVGRLAAIAKAELDSTTAKEIALAKLTALGLTIGDLKALGL